MPLYEFKCSRCGHLFEELVSLSGAGGNQLCPQCGDDKSVRLPSTFAISGSSSAAAGCPQKDQCGGGFA